jgi:hypothetical protein
VGGLDAAGRSCGGSTRATRGRSGSRR